MWFVWGNLIFLAKKSPLSQTGPTISALLSLVLLSVIASIFIALFLFLPKIYLANSLYSTSIQIDEMKTEYLSLKNENEILKSKIALLKFKNGVTHWDFLLNILF